MTMRAKVSQGRRKHGWCLAGAASVFVALAAGVPAHAQDQVPAAAAPALDSDDPMVNLIHALISEGSLSERTGAMLLEQARRKQAAPVPAQVAVSPGAVRVPYVPQTVRDEIREEVRQDVLAQAQRENWAAPNALPEWTRRITLYGDVRLRSQNDFFDPDNAVIVDFNAINAGAPYDFGTQNLFLPPIENTTSDRHVVRARARLGLRAEVAPALSVDLRLATGSDRSPVSTNQALGGLDGKKDVWLDLAQIEYRPFEQLRVIAGRMANPFAAPELLWDDDVALDGAAFSARAPLGDTGLALTVTGGAFPLSFVAQDEPATSVVKAENDTRWLYAGQAGVKYAAGDALSIGADIAYYRFGGVAGRLSSPCSSQADFCDTDYLRPAAMQRGNTLFALRQVVPVPVTDLAYRQYLGLASKFEIGQLAGHLAFRPVAGLSVRLDGSASKNFGYDERALLARATNSAGISQIYVNNEECSIALTPGQSCPAGSEIFASGDLAWLARLTVGSPRLEQFGDWNFSASYRYIEPDALLDAFTDSDFHLGGTNAKGYTIGGNFALMHNTILGARWLSANEVSGPPLAIDVLQVDLNVKF